MSFDATRGVLDHDNLSFFLSVVLKSFDTRQIVLLDVADLRTAEIVEDQFLNVITIENPSSRVECSL